MEILSQIDLRSVFVPSLHLTEIWLRGTLVYLLLFTVLRFLRREAVALSVADLLVVVLIADAAQNAMGSEYKSVTEGAVLVMTIASWDYLFDWLGYRYPWFRRILRAAPLPLIKDGRVTEKEFAIGMDHRGRTKSRASRTGGGKYRTGQAVLFGRRRSFQRHHQGR